MLNVEIVEGIVKAYNQTIGDGDCLGKATIADKARDCEENDLSQYGVGKIVEQFAKKKQGQSHEYNTDDGRHLRLRTTLKIYR